MIVMKFGGTSVGDATRIAHAARLACEAVPGSASDGSAAPVVVVVSAMAGVTNALRDVARLAAEGNVQGYRRAVEVLRASHRAVADALLEGQERQRALEFVDERLDEVLTLCHSLSVIGEVTLRALDRISGIGEKLSASLLAATLRARGREAAYVDATEVVVTDSSFGGASPLLEETRARAAQVVRPLVEAGTIPVITGYIGADRSGTPTTLGRGAGDYSAAIMGACLDADEVWIWTDVDGILTADPKIVPQACTLEELTYVEAAQLAYFGAEVLHPKTVKPLVERGIPLRIRNTFNPQHPGTLIVGQSSRVNSGPRAIITSKGLSAIAVVGNTDGWSAAVSARALVALSRAGSEVLMFGQSFVDKTIALLVRGQDTEHSVAALKREFQEELEGGVVREVTVQRPVASVSVVGAAADDSYSLASRTFAALGKQRTPVLSIAQAYSEYNVTFVVPQDVVDETVCFIHAELGLGG
ncbi:MAG: aspartate kinase [Anaerolineae bacterium]|nr:aspartate kinase [Anaerolineae bacterium]